MGRFARFIETILFERRRLKEALRDSEERFRAAFDQDAVGMLYVLQDGHILRCNQKYCDLVGYPRDEATEQNLSQFSHPEDAPALPLLCQRLIKGETPRPTYEQRFVRRDGTIFWAEVTLSPITLKGLRSAAFLAVIQDQTSHKAIEAEMKQARAAAAAAVRTKGAFLANMSHEIRTPLNAILGFSEILADEGEGITHEDRAKFAATLRRNGSLLARVMDDILDLSKVEAGKLEVESLDVSLPALIADVATLLGRQAQESGIHFSAHIDGTVPERITSDPTRLRQILTHIIGNAIKFTKHGSVELTLRHVKDPDGDDQIAFHVKDTGRGIAEAEKDALFQTFSQTDASTTRRFNGTGLGLALSRRLARLLGGDVVLLASEPGKGSTFVVSVPVGRQIGVPYIRELPDPPQPHRQGAVVASERRTRLKGIHVLLAEDALDNQMLIRRILVANGAKVDIAGDGLEVLTKAWATDYDIILMDLQMPRLDGYDATESLRRQGYKKPIIALTAHAMKEERERALKAGVNDHLTKPVSQNHLVITVAQYSLANAYHRTV